MFVVKKQPLSNTLYVCFFTTNIAEVSVPDYGCFFTTNISEVSVPDYGCFFTTNISEVSVPDYGINNYLNNLINN
jgi:hypothetical protein